MISILLPCYKSEALLRSLWSQGVPDAEIVFYDNGGNGSALQDIDAPNVKVIGDGKNIGLNAALNQCAEAATHSYFYLCHTDMVLAPDWHEALLREAKRHAPCSFMFCSRSIERNPGHTPFHIIDDCGDIDSDDLDHAKMQEHFQRKTHGIVTAYRMPFFLSRALWDKMGGVDEKYFSFASDDDLFMSAYDVGARKFWMINDSMVYHMQGKSNAQQSVDRDSQAPYDYFFSKWRAKGYKMTGNIDRDMQNLIPWNLKIK